MDSPIYKLNLLAMGVADVLAPLESPVSKL